MKKLTLVLSCLLISILFCLNEYFISFTPTPEKYFITRLFLKFGMSFIPTVLAFFGWRKAKDKLSFHILLGLVFCSIGDVAINFNLSAGAFSYLIGHVIFLKGFLSERKPNLIQIIIWPVIAILIITGIVCAKLFIAPEATTLSLISGCVYTVFMTGMVICSFCAPLQICIGGVLFGISDILLMRNVAFGETPLSHIFALGIYYVGVILIGSHYFMKQERITA